MRIVFPSTFIYLFIYFFPRLIHSTCLNVSKKKKKKKKKIYVHILVSFVWMFKNQSKFH